MCKLSSPTGNWYEKALLIVNTVILIIDKLTQPVNQFNIVWNKSLLLLETVGPFLKEFSTLDALLSIRIAILPYFSPIFQKAVHLFFSIIFWGLSWYHRNISWRHAVGGTLRRSMYFSDSIKIKQFDKFFFSWLSGLNIRNKLIYFLIQSIKIFRKPKTLRVSWASWKRMTSNAL